MLLVRPHRMLQPVGAPDTGCGTDSAGREEEVTPVTPLGPGLVLPLLQAKEVGSPCPPAACQTPGTLAASEGSTLKKGHGAAVGGLWAREDPSLFTLQMGFVWSTLPPLPPPPRRLPHVTYLPHFTPSLSASCTCLPVPIPEPPPPGRHREILRCSGPSDIAGKQHTSQRAGQPDPTLGQMPCCGGEFR